MIHKRFAIAFYKVLHGAASAPPFAGVQLEFFHKHGSRGRGIRPEAAALPYRRELRRFSWACGSFERFALAGPRIQAILDAVGSSLISAGSRGYLRSHDPTVLPLRGLRFQYHHPVKRCCFLAVILSTKCHPEDFLLPEISWFIRLRYPATEKGPDPAPQTRCDIPRPEVCFRIVYREHAFPESPCSSRAMSA